MAARNAQQLHRIVHSKSPADPVREQGFFWQFKARRSIEYQAHGGILLWPPYRRWNALIRKKNRRPWFSQKPPVQNGRTDVSAVRRLFSFAVVRHFLYSSSSNLIRQSSRKCHHEASFTGWNLTFLWHLKTATLSDDRFVSMYFIQQCVAALPPFFVPFCYSKPKEQWL